MHDMHI